MTRSRDAVIPLLDVCVERDALGARCRVQAVAERVEQTDDALALLADLDRVWGPAGELDRLAAAPVGSWSEVGWDTILLLSRAALPGLAVDVAGRRVRTLAATGPGVLPDPDARHTLAAELISYELIDAGCLAAQVDVGAFRSSVNRGIRVAFG